MVRIRHKQTGEEEVISITVWLDNQKFNHETWNAIKIVDAVNLFIYKNGKWEFHNTVERDTAVQIISESPNQFKYQPSRLNTVMNNEDASFIMGLDRMEADYRSSLLENRPINIPDKRQTTPQPMKTSAGTWVVKIFAYIVKHVRIMAFWVLITVIGSLLVICIVNYFHHKGFTL